MLWELARAPIVQGPMRALRVAKVLKLFRVRREELREIGSSSECLAELQYSTVSEQLGLDVPTVRAIVEEWIMEKPLRHLGAALRPGTRAALESLRDGGVRIGVFSDYPPADKLVALGIDDLVETSCSAVDPDVNAFKPDPAGFLHGARTLGVDPEDVVYVGDRLGMDGLGAQNAGMRSVILDTGLRHVGETGGASAVTVDPERCRWIERFEEVPRAVGLS